MARPSLLKPAARSLCSSTFSNHATTRTFHNTRCLAGSPLFNLGGLSTSRESQYLSKERGLPRTDFAPHLELIKSSEVEPFATRADSPRTVQPQERYKAPGSKIPQPPVGDAPPTTFTASDVLRMVKEMQDKTAALEKEMAAARTLRKELDRSGSLMSGFLVILLAVVFYTLWNLEKLVELKGMELLRDKSQPGSLNLVDDNSDQKANGPRDGTDEGVTTAAGVLSHIPRSEWDQLRRSVEMLLDAGIRREEKESLKEAPRSRLKTWLWSSSSGV
ncbi:MAG: hypothetical protein Q9182_001505 [Xanthomendoza sp. 2 TL-2023]